MSATRQPTTSAAPSVTEALTDGHVSRRSFWLNGTDRPVAAWAHYPADERVRPNAVVVCPPFGFEYAHAYRTLIHLADRLAEEGFLVLRVDYPGTGTSAGDEEDEGLVEAWLGSIDQALDMAGRLTGGTPASLVGLRLGGLLAGVVAGRREVHALAAWAPILRGRRFVREIRALHSVSAEEGVAPDGFLQAGGFRISDATAEELGTLSFPTDTRILTGALVIDRTDQPIARLPDSESLGVPVHRVEQSSFADMMAEPHFTRVPHATLRHIVEWFTRGTPAERRPLDDDAVAEIVAARTCEMTSPDGTSLTEELVTLTSTNGERVFGILCQPAGGTARRDVVLLPNAGAVHHMGPNRLYVELARDLGGAGVPSFRFDLRNLGDARIGASIEENHPYPSTAIDDVGMTARWLISDRGFTSCVVAGLCSGAHTAFHAGLQVSDVAISSLIGINPLTFRFEAGMTLDTPMSQTTSREARYYLVALRSRASWQRLLTGKSSVPYLAQFVRRRVRQRVGSGLRYIARRVGLRKPGPLETDLLKLQELGRPIHFVFSSTDPGGEILAHEAPVTVSRMARAGALTSAVIEDADHTFSRKEHRSLAIAEVRRHLHAEARPVTCTIVAPGPELWPTIRPAWVALREATGDASAFLSETWIEQWLTWFGERRHARGLIWSNEEGEAVGCAFISTDRAAAGPFSMSRVLLNASGVSGVGCEHNDVLALPSYREAVVRDLAIQLNSQDTDQIVLSGIRRPLFESLVRDTMARWEGVSSDAPFVPLARLRDEGQSYLSSLSPNTRRQVRRGIRGYERRFGPLDFSVATSAAAATEMFEDMLPLHDARWSDERAASGFTAEARRFHAELIHRSFEDGVTDLEVLFSRIRFGEETIGILYHLVCDRRVHFFQAGLKYHADSRLKPGMVSHALSAQYCLEEGHVEYDLLGGEPTPVRYKQSLTTDERVLYWCAVDRPTPKARLVARLRGVSRRFRAMRSTGSPAPRQGA